MYILLWFFFKLNIKKKIQQIIIINDYTKLIYVNSLFLLNYNIIVQHDTI